MVASSFLFFGSVQRPKFDDMFLVVVAVGITYRCFILATGKLKSLYTIHVPLLFHHFYGCTTTDDERFAGSQSDMRGCPRFRPHPVPSGN